MNEHRWKPTRRGTLKRLALAIGLALPAVAQPGFARSKRERDTIAVRSVIERYAGAWQKGDLAAIQDCYHEDFTLHYFGRNPLSGTHAGKQRALAALVAFTRKTRRQLVRIDATMAGPERGAIIATERLGDGADTVELQRVFVYSVADDRLRECWVFDADPAAIDRMW